MTLALKTLEDTRLEDFLEYAGYSESDVLAFNPETGKISTRNSGLYQVTETGKVLHFSGPSPDPTDRV